jgi:hypothetical protein
MRWTRRARKRKRRRVETRELLKKKVPSRRRRRREKKKKRKELNVQSNGTQLKSMRTCCVVAKGEEKLLPVFFLPPYWV